MESANIVWAVVSAGALARAVDLVLEQFDVTPRFLQFPLKGGDPVGGFSLERVVRNNPLVEA